VPAIRDSVFAQESVTTDGGLTIPMCDYAEGDLLFAFLIGDTGTPTLGCTNGVGTWTSLFQRTNTVMFSVWWKYAAASGEGSVVFTSNVNDTYCGWVTSVRDVFQGYTVPSPPVRTDANQAAATRFNMPTLAAQANSLILMASANSSTQPSHVFGEGRGITRILINGTAEGGSLGWFLQASTATTPADIPCGVTVGGGGVAAVIECRAPLGGATVLPAYVASDDSLLMLLNPGSAYDSSTALGATADTNFGTTFDGITANDATVAIAVADVGVDPKGFLGSAGITNAASVTAISGAEAVVPAGKYNLGNANVLGHLRSLTTVASQNMGAIGTTRGVWFGMKSAADAPPNAEYKIWQVHGSDAPYYGTSVVPFVVNPANTNTRATNGVFDTADVRRYGWWLSGSGVFTGQLLLGSVWKMGTTVVAGGVAAEPVGIEGLETALTKGKVRWSAIRNGANQLLCLQAAQFGNGGTNPIFLDLNATAVEFPSQRNVTRKLINYNGIDDAIGFTYYAGASDTIKHRASVISSPSKYHWRIHASSHVDADYDFAGLSIIGAGDVQLRAVTTFSGMSFTNCGSITQNAAVINSCSFSNSKIFSATPAAASVISNSDFVSGGTGHALEISGSAAHISLAGNSFTGYAGSNGVTGNEAIYVNIASGTMTITITGGGSTPSIRTAGCAVTVANSKLLTLTGLVTGSDVVIKTSDTNVALVNVDANPGTTYGYSYGYVAATYVDVKIMKAGYRPYQVYDYLLQNSDASLPIAQEIDRAYA
jgi:hypothetical protein